MNLITPAAWYGGQDHGGKRQRKEAEAAEEDRRAEVLKSPVVRSLGKMFGESSFLSFFSEIMW